MIFTHPIWLWGLTGLAVPLAIHLLSRKTGKVIYLGSLRHLEDTSTTQFRSLRLNEWWLLLVRCLILTCIVMALAGASFQHTDDTPQRWLVIEPGLQHRPEVTAWRDSLEQQGFTTHGLTAGFPEASDSLIDAHPLPYRQLMHQLLQQRLQQAVVISTSRVSRLRGPQLALPPAIQWITLEPESISQPMSARRFTADSVLVTHITSTPHATSFHTTASHIQSTAVTSLPLDSAKALTIAVVYDTTTAADKDILVAALNAIQRTTRLTLVIQAVHKLPDTPCDGTFWLLAETPPAHLTSPSFRLMDIPQAPVLLSHDDARLYGVHPGKVDWLITQHLQRTNVLREHVVVQLAAILLPAENTSRIDSLDQRVTPEALYTVAATMPDIAGASAPNEMIWWILVAVLLLCERLIAYSRRA